MIDPIAPNELVRNLLDAYRIFSLEMRAIGKEQAKLVKTIIARVDSERLADAQRKIMDLTYERRS
jgi:hypothetical protein